MRASDMGFCRAFRLKPNITITTANLFYEPLTFVVTLVVVFITMVFLILRMPKRLQGLDNPFDYSENSSW